MARKKLVMGESWANTPDAPAEPPPPAEAQPAPPPGVKVMLMCKSVFLPADPTQADWRSAPTRKYQGETDNRRTRVVVHPELAAFLQARKQAETLD